MQINKPPKLRPVRTNGILWRAYLFISLISFFLIESKSIGGPPSRPRNRTPIDCVAATLGKVLTELQTHSGNPAIDFPPQNYPDLYRYPPTMTIYRAQGVTLNNISRLESLIDFDPATDSPHDTRVTRTREVIGTHGVRGLLAAQWEQGGSRNPRLTIGASEDLGESAHYGYGETIIGNATGRYGSEPRLRILAEIRPNRNQDPLLQFRAVNTDNQFHYNNEVGLFGSPSVTSMNWYMILGSRETVASLYGAKPRNRFFRILDRERLRERAIEWQREALAQGVSRDEPYILERYVPSLIQQGIISEDPVLSALDAFSVQQKSLTSIISNLDNHSYQTENSLLEHLNRSIQTLNTYVDALRPHLGDQRVARSLELFDEIVSTYRRHPPPRDTPRIREAVLRFENIVHSLRAP